MKKAIITAKNLSIGYPKAANREKAVLHKNLSFDLYAGELTCLLGPNGAGKSTLLRTSCSMQKPIDGEILLDGKSLHSYSESELSYKFGLVLTDETSVGGFTVSQLVGLGRYPHTGFFGKLSKNDYAIIEKAMSDVGISHKAQSYIAELSDGERQKTMIAKALAQECPIVFLDEPTAFLDVVSRIEIMNLLHHLAYTQNKTILLSTHDIELALLLADRLWLLSRENGLECGVTEDILLSDAMEVFLARNNIIFDKETGNFLPVQQYDRFAYVEGIENPVHWAKNFLRRNYWNITQDKTRASFILNITAENKMEVMKDNGKEIIGSFNDLHNWLEKNYPFKSS